jgi:hypothetical protein
VNPEHLDRPVVVITGDQCVIDLDDRPKGWYALPGALAEQIDRLYAEELTEQYKCQPSRGKAGHHFEHPRSLRWSPVNDCTAAWNVSVATLQVPSRLTSSM